MPNDDKPKDLLLPQERDLLDRMRLKIAQRFKLGDWHEPKVKSFTVEIVSEDRSYRNGTVLYGYRLHAEMEDGSVLDCEGLGY